MIMWRDTKIAVGRHHECGGRYSVRWRDTMMRVEGYHDCRGEASRSTVADIQYSGGIP